MRQDRCDGIPSSVITKEQRKQDEELEDLAEAVKEACEARLTDKKQIIIKRCIAISEDDLPVSRARVLMHWRLEHMTLRADGDQPGPISA